MLYVLPSYVKDPRISSGFILLSLFSRETDANVAIAANIIAVSFAEIFIFYV